MSTDSVPADQPMTEQRTIDEQHRQTRAALDQFIAAHLLPAPHWVHLYGGRPDSHATWLQVQLASVADAWSWAAAMGTTPEAQAWIPSDRRLRCVVHVARNARIPDCPVRVDVDYFPDDDALQARQS